MSSDNKYTTAKIFTNNRKSSGACSRSAWEAPINLTLSPRALIFQIICSILLITGIEMYTFSNAHAETVDIAIDTFEAKSWSTGLGWSEKWYHEGDARIVAKGQPHSGTHHMRLRARKAWTDRPLDLSGHGNARLGLYVKVKSFEKNDWADLMVKSGTDDWKTLRRFTSDDSNNRYQYYEFDLGPYGLNGNFWIGFEAEMNGKNDFLFVDDIRVFTDDPSKSRPSRPESAPVIDIPSASKPEPAPISDAPSHPDPKPVQIIDEPSASKPEPTPISDVPSDSEPKPVVIAKPKFEPILGVTIDDISHVGDIKDALSKFARRPFARIVFDEYVKPSYYKDTVADIRTVADIMGEILDSFYVKDYSQKKYEQRAREYVNTMADEVDIWEIGNEINGEWLGQGAMDKAAAAYDIVKAAGEPTALTLYYNGTYENGQPTANNCWEKPEHQMEVWAEKNVPEHMKKGLDWVLVSFYEEDCENISPDWNKVFEDLHAIFPNSKLGFGEVGSSVNSQKETIIRKYYNMKQIRPEFIGGYFWWYFKQDMVRNNSGMLDTLNNCVLTWDEKYN